MNRPQPGKTIGAGERIGNRFGIVEALLGLVAGITLSAIAVGAYDAASHHATGASGYGDDVASLLGLWIGLIGAMVIAKRQRRSRDEDRSPPSFASTYGFSIRPLVDVPLGIAVGVGAQFVLVPLFELPLLPFVHNLSQRLGAPARTLTDHVSGSGLVLLGILVCLGSPIVEELFFRGLLLRGLLGWRSRAGRGIGTVGSVVICGVCFGLVHFEALQLTALIGFGCVLGALAVIFGRLGPGIVAHAAFNATTFIALAHTH